MCFSATANFVGSGVLGAIGVVTLTKVKHKRELLFASLPTLFAVHQFIEGFVWLGLDGVLSPAVTHDMGAAFVLYAQGLLPFLLPLSVLLFEPTVKARRRMLPFLAIGTGTTLYMLWALIAYPLHIFVRGDSIVYINDGTNNTALAVLICDCDLRLAVLLASEGHGDLWRGQPGDSADGDGGETVCFHFALVCVCGGRERDYSGLFLEEPADEAV